MNKQNIGKLQLFILGLKNRYEENTSIFKGVTTKYKSGLKEFKGIGAYSDGKIKYSFNGEISYLTIDDFFSIVICHCNNYDTFELIYSERGTNIVISADNKSVTMKNIVSNELTDITESQSPTHNTETSSLLNRNYYIKVGKADSLLKEIGIMSQDGKIKNDKIRKYNQIDRYVELFDDMLSKMNRTNSITILDCGCGKSYLSFVLNYYLTEVKKIKCNFIGLDYKHSVIETSKKMAENLGYRNMEFQAVDMNNYVATKKINVVMSLHACDTATDMALAVGIKVDADAIIAVPCCHREMLSQFSYEPFKNITKYGVLKARLADTLTDGLRALMLDAKGYDVNIIEYISPLETPKNLMIKAIKVKDENEDAMNDYLNLMGKLNVYPSLYGYLNTYDE